MKKHLLPLAWAAWTFTAGAPSAASAGFHIPIEQFKLDNGLRAVLSKDSSAPVVTVYLLYDVGARSEERGRTGFAHLFEHMMFQGSENAPKGTMDKLDEGNGGFNNGSTHPDYTDYFQVLPSNKLPIALWLEADRMRGLLLTQENLANQKEAVKQERRLSFDNRPYATAVVDVWPTVAFRNWSNSHSLIGSFEDLNNATLDDVRSFFRTYYAPNNAILAVVGDIDLAATKKMIETYFAGIPSQPHPPKPNLAEAGQTASRFQRYTDPLAQVPALVIGYPGPERRTPDYYALAMLDVILTGGDSSRFQQNLVKGKKTVIQFEADLGWPFASVSDYKPAGMYAMNILFPPNLAAGEIVSQVQEEITKVQREGVSAEELERARNLFRAGRVRSMETSLSRARLLAQYTALDGDPNLINSEMERFLAVTPGGIKDVSIRYLTPEKRSVLAIDLKKPAAQEGK
ncbi:MAG: insulinase family protein [Bryobacterales bacterium]|nr:insulinase family protein [Bryobacterales bacterium]